MLESAFLFSPGQLRRFELMLSLGLVRPLEVAVMPYHRLDSYGMPVKEWPTDDKMIVFGTGKKATTPRKADKLFLMHHTFSDTNGVEAFYLQFGHPALRVSKDVDIDIERLIQDWLRVHHLKGYIKYVDDPWL